MTRNIQAVIFDMDGTITCPLLDFPRMKAEIGVDERRGLLESISELSPSQRLRASEILLAHELAAARDSTLNDGVADTLAELSRLGLKTAILTRNCREATRIVCAKHALEFDAVVTRQDCLPKPDPDGVFAAARSVGVEPHACLMVGDYEFDVLAGGNAGAVTVLYAPLGNSFPTQPDFEISSMADLIDVVSTLNADYVR